MSVEEPMDESVPTDEQEIRNAGAVLRSAMPPMRFTTGFADRAMARIAAERVTVAPEVLQFTAMQRSFRLLAAAAALTIVALGAHNTLLARTEYSSLVDAALGLEPVSAEAIFSSSDTFQ